jgi:hypothetical protein
VAEEVNLHDLGLQSTVDAAETPKRTKSDPRPLHMEGGKEPVEKIDLSWKARGPAETGTPRDERDLVASIEQPCGPSVSVG